MATSIPSGPGSADNHPNATLSNVQQVPRTPNTSQMAGAYMAEQGQFGAPPWASAHFNGYWAGGTYVSTFCELEARTPTPVYIPPMSEAMHPNSHHHAFPDTSIPPSISSHSFSQSSLNSSQSSSQSTSQMPSLCEEDIAAIRKALLPEFRALVETTIDARLEELKNSTSTDLHTESPSAMRGKKKWPKGLQLSNHAHRDIIGCNIRRPSGKELRAIYLEQERSTLRADGTEILQPDFDAGLTNTANKAVINKVVRVCSNNEEFKKKLDDGSLTQGMLDTGIKGYFSHLREQWSLTGSTEGETKLSRDREWNAQRNRDTAV
ncbi:uncharacterized protein EI90DRAFT_3023989 [Cantharellus anzutake]|uniref:uncharacterized protein n=1 Tax=Cantharellus anzutake TaxID=1750568 RepID=UPI0019050560|nr:uncharacterized protein EI90DRAFT_3023989 [Cantharellus anzutake]KAF8310920.1 hypothetical protein EI90DRAFT_3023989 [Cantharellus anzutake]